MLQGLIGLLALLNVSLNPPTGLISPLAQSFTVQSEKEILAQMPMDLSKRYEDQWVNEVFSDNIRLGLWKLQEVSKVPEVPKVSEVSNVSKVDKIDWEKVRKDFNVSFVLKPGEVFAFHDQILPEYKDRVVKTMGSHFIAEEGYRSSGYLYGDGVCHLASLLNWAASKAGLKVVAKADHSFRPIFGVPKDYGTSIRYDKAGGLNTQNQNLYITNTFDYPVEFKFEIKGEMLEIKILRD